MDAPAGFKIVDEDPPSEAVATGATLDEPPSERQTRPGETPGFLDQLDAATDFFRRTSGNPPAIPWFIPGMMPARETTLLAGAGGGGKTLIELMHQAAGATGSSWLGFPARRFRSLGLYTEDNLEVSANRLHAIARHYDCSVKQMMDFGMRLLPKPRGNVSLIRVERNGELSTTEAWNDLRRMLDRERPEFLVLDNVADYLPVLQFDNTAIRAARRIALDPLCEDYDLTICGLQNVSLAGLRATDEAEGSSGGLAWRDAFRSRIHLAAFKPDDDGAFADPDLRVFGTVKANYSGKERRLLRYRDGVFVVEDTGGSGSGTDQRRNEQWLKDAIIKHVQAGKPYSVSNNAQNSLIKILARADNRPKGFGMKAIKDAFLRFTANDVITTEYQRNSRRGCDVERIVSVDGIQLDGENAV